MSIKLAALKEMQEERTPTNIAGFKKMLKNALGLGVGIGAGIFAQRLMQHKLPQMTKWVQNNPELASKAFGVGTGAAAFGMTQLALMNRAEEIEAANEEFKRREQSGK